MSAAARFDARTFLVVGGSGYVGENLLSRLRSRNPRATLFDIHRGSLGRETRWKTIQQDVLAPGMPRLLAKLRPDVIYLVAATPKAAPLSRQWLLYVEGTRRLLKAAAEAGLSATIIVAGSAAEYGYSRAPIGERSRTEPQSDYGIAKLAQTHVSLLCARELGLRLVVARIFNAYGRSPRSDAVTDLVWEVARAERARPADRVTIRAQNLNSRRDFIHVIDVADALIALSSRVSSVTGSPSIYNVGSGHATSIRSLLDQLLSLSSVHDVDVAASGPQDVTCSRARITKIARDCGWRPSISLRQGLGEELDYRRSELAAVSSKASRGKIRS